MRDNLGESQGVKFADCLTRLLAVTLIVAAGNSTELCADQGAKQSITEHDWPQLLGPNRNGVSHETGLLKTWPSDGPKIVWRVQGGIGMSGLAISQGRLVTLLQRSGKQLLVVFNAKTGELVHEIALAPAYRNSMGAGPRATPTIVKNKAYAFSGEGILSAVDLINGKALWQDNVITSLNGKPAEYGMACSPLVVGSMVIVTAGVPGGTVVAYDRSSGSRLWQSGSDTAGYSSPALLAIGGRDQLVVFNGKAAIGLDPKTGRRFWRYPYVTDYDCNIATPIAYKDQVFISSGENHGCALLSVTPDNNSFKATATWTSFGPESVMRNEWQTSILLGQHLYGMDNVGGAGPVTHLNCVDIQTGTRVWQRKRFGKGNLIAADGKLWISTTKGELVVVQATPTQFREIGRMTLLESTRQAPALSAGRLYLRDNQEIVCVNVLDMQR